MASHCARERSRSAEPQSRGNSNAHRRFRGALPGVLR